MTFREWILIVICFWVDEKRKGWWNELRWCCLWIKTL